MSLQEYWNDFQGAVAEYLPRFAGAIAILVVGWLVAMLLRAAVRKALGAIKLDERLQRQTQQSMSMERIFSQVVYGLVLVLAFVACLTTLELHLVTGPLQAFMQEVLEYLPKMLGAALLLVMAWILATLVRRVVCGVMGSETLAAKLGEQSDSVAASTGRAVYYLVFLLFLPAVLETLELQGLLQPVQGLVESFLGVLPGLFAATVMIVAGWFVARLVRDIVRNLLEATNADGVAEKAGLPAGAVSRAVPMICYVLILVPAVIAGLNASGIEAIARPAVNILDTLMAFVPKLIGAAAIALIAVYVGRFAANVVVSLLSSIGFDRVPFLRDMKLGQTSVTPSQLVGHLVRVWVLLMAVTEAARHLQLEQLSLLVSTLLEFTGRVVLGAVIVGAGAWIAQTVHGALHRSGDGSSLAAGVVRFAIVGLAVAMGLRAMGLADQIINLAFGLTLGAAAVAFAIAFGVGGRAAAGQMMEHWAARLKDGTVRKQTPGLGTSTGKA